MFREFVTHEHPCRAAIAGTPRSRPAELEPGSLARCAECESWAHAIQRSPSIYLLLSDAHFVEMVSVADDFASGRLCVGFVEDYGVGLLRGFTRRRVQIEFAVFFALD